MKKTFTLLLLLSAVAISKAQTFNDTLALDGNAQFAALPAGALNNLSIFTVEFWVKTTESRTNSTYWQRPYLFGNATNFNNSGDFGITTDNGYIGMFEGFSNNNADQYFESPTVKINDNAWHHVAAVNNGNYIYLYVDGHIVDSLVSGQVTITAFAPLTVGAASLDFGVNGNSYAYTNFPSQGTFAKIRLSDNVRYTTDFVPATSFTTDANTVALYNFAGQCGVKSPDLSANHNDLTVNTAKPSCSTLAFGGDLSFDGTSQYIRTPKAMLNTATNFTVETWFKSTDLGANNNYLYAPTIFGIENSGSGTGDFAVTTQAGYLSFWDDMDNGSAATNALVTKAFVCDGQWHHIAAVAAGTTLTVFVDGVNAGVLGISQGVNTASLPITIMRLNSQTYGAIGYHRGEIDEIRFSDSARYTANFTPPTAVFAPDAHTVALYHLNSCGSGTTADASTNHNDGFVFGITACGGLPAQVLQAQILYSHHNSFAPSQQDSVYTLDSSGKRTFITFGYRPRLSHNGKYLAFSNGPVSNSSYQANLWVRDLTTQTESLIVSNGDYLDYYDFYPSDKRLVYSEGCSIYSTNIDGSNAYTNLNGYPGDCFSDDPTIRIADSLIAYHNVHYGLFTMNSDGSSPAKVPNTVAGDLDPSWSPNGQWLAYYKPIPGSYNGGAGAYVPTNSVYKIKVDGSDSTRLSFFGLNDTLAADPIWANDMQSLYAIGRINDTMGIYQISTNGSGEYHRIRTFDAEGSVADYWLGLSDSIKTNLLPVTLINFTGENLGKLVQLNWQTTQEVNSSYFGVERSVNGVHFTTIGTVAAKGNSSTTNSYHFADDALPGLANNSNIYYRLKQVDKDGRYQYTNVVTINLRPVTSTLVYPNPNNGVFTIVTKNTNPKLDVVIVDAMGRQVYHQVYSNTNAALVNLPVAKGIYMINIFDGKTTTHQKVAVQ